jgi:hypothetical protein
MDFAGEDFNTMERNNTNKAIETNVKKAMIKIKSNGVTDMVVSTAATWMNPSLVGW